MLHAGFFFVVLSCVDVHPELAICRVVALAAICGAAACAASGPVREAVSPAILGRAMPAFYNGYLYSLEPRHVVNLFAPDGSPPLTLVIPGHGNGKVNVESVAVDTDGSLAIAWADLPDAGIDLRDAMGNLIRTIDTGSYIASHLSFDANHAVWSLGWQHTPDQREDSQDYMIVRKYSPEGKETGAYLPRSLFPPGLAPGMQEWQTRRIFANSDRVGVEAVSGKVGNQREWVELDLNGNVTGRWKLDPSDKFPGVALTSDGQIYVHRYDRAAKSWRVFRLDRASATWLPVAAPDAELYGADGDQMVFAEWPDGVMHLSWYPQ
jgi:hypothetical protein